MKIDGVEWVEGMLAAVDLLLGGPWGECTVVARMVEDDHVVCSGTYAAISCDGGSWRLSWYNDDQEFEEHQPCTEPHLVDDDAATAGCLLAEARRRWADPSLHTFQDEQGFYGVEGRITGELCHADSTQPWRTGNEIRALLGAIRLLPKQATP